MTTRTILFGACLAFARIAAIGQTTAGSGDPPKTTAPETPSDQKAYSEATHISDPEKKIAALEKWKKDFPTSAMLQNADRQIFSTLTEKLPDQQDRIRKLAAAMYRSAGDKKAKGSTANTIAEQLLNAGILLKDAEGYAEKSVKTMSLADYTKDQLARSKKRDEKPPSKEELQKRYTQMRAPRVGTLGRIYVKLGQSEKGRKLLEESYAGNRDNPQVTAALGELAALAGDDAKALDYLVRVRLSGKMQRSANEALESVYKKTHNGSLEGLDAMLDSEYHRLYPNPLHLERYKPAEHRSDRVVLAELFTGAGCPPCVGADLAFDAAMERYSRKELAFIAYHVHIPRPDPMTNLDTIARQKDCGVNAVPTYIIDGKKTTWGGDRDYARQILAKFQGDLEKDLDTPAEAHLKAEASVVGNTVKVEAAVDGIKSESKDLKVQIALLEKELRYSGENGIRFHPMVVRAMGGEKGAGFALEPAGGQFSQLFDLDVVSKAIKAHLDDYESKGHRGEPFKFTEKKYQIDRANLAVVVFVQDAKTRHVLQAAFVDLGGGAGAHPTETGEER